MANKIEESKIILGSDVEAEGVRQTLGSLIFKEVYDLCRARQQAGAGDFFIDDNRDESNVAVRFVETSGPAIKEFKLGLQDQVCFMNGNENLSVGKVLVIYYCVDSEKLLKFKEKVKTPGNRYIIMFNGFDRDGVRGILEPWHAEKLISAIWLSPHSRPELERKSTYRALKSLNTGQVALRQGQLALHTEIQSLREEIIKLFAENREELEKTNKREN